MSFGRYQFLPWARRGISARINEVDTLGQTPGTAVERAEVSVGVKINDGTPESQNFTLLGPGDITGVQADMIIRTEPREGVTDFEPNVLPYIEFYDEDFPWRYTPARGAGTAGEKLRPWLALFVLREGEFEETNRRVPLPTVRVLDPTVLPPANELHLWAHGHSNLPHTQTNFETFIDNLEEDVKTDPDGLYSRLLCPRKLEANILYHAFLVPAFETGRQAGLGRPPAGIPAQQTSWPAGDLEFPIYHRWSFRTGANFDFEYLVKLLEPRIMDKRVGMRPMDCSRPGFVRADSPQEVPPPEPQIMLLEGALKAPSAVSTDFPPEATPQPFFDELEKLVNLNRFQEEHPDEDPYVTVPFYGMYHAMRKDLTAPGKRSLPTFDPASLVWYNDLNRDPRTRVPAGFGVRIVQENQEKFMDQAWKQLSDVLEANRRLRFAQWAAQVSERLYLKNLQPLAAEQVLAIAQPLATRIRIDQLTLKQTVAVSPLPVTVFSPVFRRMSRLNSPFIRRLSTERQPLQLAKVVERMNAVGGLTAAPKANFQALPQVAGITKFQPPLSMQGITVWSLQSNLETSYVFNLLNYTGGLPSAGQWTRPFDPRIFTGGVIGPGSPVIRPGGGVVNPGTGGGGVINPGGPVVTPGGGGVVVNPGGPVINPGGPVVTPGGGGVVINPGGPVITPGGGVIRPGGGVVRPPGGGVIRPGGGRDAGDAYVQAFNDVAFRFSYQQTAPAKQTLSVQKVASTTLAKVEPKLAYSKYINHVIQWPVGTPVPEKDFLPAMAYPDIPEPSYKYLVDIDKELILPNLELIPQNTLSLLRTNQKFIESYLVGLNYEMGRELLWREYPTDMRGSYFRQFWDVRGFVTPDTTPKDAESLKDIKPIHTWLSTSQLGKHNARDAEGDAEQLVFVIRGDLLKKFPNTVIYAQKAFKDDKGRKIIHTELTEAQFKKEVLFPQYQAELPPDIKLLGFDLTIEQAAGADPAKGFTDKLGWFFILAEVPGEPRFGMDITYNPNKPTEFTWNDLSWENFGGQPIAFVGATPVPGNTGKAGGTFNPPTDPKTGIWGKSAADMAAILLQRPVMVAVHATEMLDIKVPDESNIIGELFTLRQHIQLYVKP